MKKTLIFLLPAVFAITAAFAQQTTTTGLKPVKPLPSKLFLEVAKADSLVFAAFNNCDTVGYRKFIKDDLEFYHDLGGLTVGVDNEMKSIKEMCARGNHIRRELLKETLEVYPLKGYGAVEIGVHRFYHTNKGQSEKLSGEYKFVQVWELTNGQWKIARVISYGHDVMHND
ncbi:nuclear transport factor 2 family protein [Pedobacter nototheniae]|uniref:nuclear transport factor 2 family protein n=1 Tax=Pedobacter nototheniae TaxID=2488994 RepID=UPI002930EC83|nr:nuclear transport factor 2 family protein [Pedobacter nototheniae]